MDHNFWNERFLEKDVYGEEANTFLKEKAHLIKENGQVLCIAEGQGRNALYLAQKFLQVSAVDQSKIGIEQIREKAKSKNLSLSAEVCDLREYDFGDGKWDAIVSIFGHLPQELRIQVHQKIMRGLKVGGLFIMEGYSKDQLKYETGGPKNIDMLLTPEIIKRELPHLEVMTLNQLERDVIEGAYHTGQSSVVQYVGRKN